MATKRFRCDEFDDHEQGGREAVGVTNCSLIARSMRSPIRYFLPDTSLQAVIVFDPASIIFDASHPPWPLVVASACKQILVQVAK